MQVNKIAFSILYIARCHGYGSFCFLAILGRFWGLKNWFLAHIYNSTPPKCKIISKNLLYHYKVSSLAFLEKKIIALNITLVLFLHHALQYVFRTCKIDIFTLFLDPKMSTCQGSQKIFLSAVIRANIGLFISGEKNLGNRILL